MRIILTLAATAVALTLTACGPDPCLSDPRGFDACAADRAARLANMGGGGSSGPSAAEYNAANENADTDNDGNPRLNRGQNRGNNEVRGGRAGRGTTDSGDKVTNIGGGDGSGSTGNGGNGTGGNNGGGSGNGNADSDSDESDSGNNNGGFGRDNG